MRRMLLAWLLGLLATSATAAAFPAVPSRLTLRTGSTSNPRGLIAGVRAALDRGAYANDPAAEREALWWMGHAGVNVSDAAVVTEAIARLDSLASVGHDNLARSYAGFLGADLRLARGDVGGVSDALRAAALQLDSPDPARRALAKFQLCDAYTMANQPASAQPLCAQADAAFGALRDAWDQAQAKNDEGVNAYAVGQYAAAAGFYRAATALYDQVGDRAQALMVGDNLAQVYLKQGRPAEAIALSRASLANERAAGRESDALNSQYDIARALDAMGRHHAAMALIATTVDEARKAKLGGQLPDLLQEQSRLAGLNGDPRLALAAEREALQAAQKNWLHSLNSQQAELAARYAAREKEARIRELEHANQIKNLKLRTAQAEAARNAMRVRRQRTTTWAAVVTALGLLLGIASLLLLVRSQRRYARELRRQAREDPLTGVDNRRGFFDRVARLLERAAPVRPPLHALLLLDFDYFKRINDRCGHPFGDIVLGMSLERLAAVVGNRGHLARLGGEEFVALCPGLGAAAALQLAGEMRAAVSALAFPEAPQDLVVTISVGVALFDGTRCHDVASWLHGADTAMYAAKAKGRDQIAIAGEVQWLLGGASRDMQPAADS